MAVSERTELLRDIFDIMGVMKRGMHGQFLQSFERLGLSPSQAQLLMTISELQPISHKALANKMQLTPGAVSQLLDGLDQAGCISRVQSETDRRINYLSVTKAGKQKLQEFGKMREQLLTKAFTTLSDQELLQYRTIQRKLVTYFESERSANQLRKEQ